MSDYYFILGIDKNADLNRIKRAYRFNCKKYHPDLASHNDKNNFLKIQEAYETLSDYEKRQKYDKSLEKQTGQIPVHCYNTDFQEEWDSPFTSTYNFKNFSSVIEDFFKGIMPGFFEEEFAETKDLYLELILSPEEAGAGGDYPIEIPVLEACPTCSGRGYINLFECPACNGIKNIHNSKTIILRIPPRFSPGTVKKVSLEVIGLQNVYLNVNIVIR